MKLITFLLILSTTLSAQTATELMRKSQQQTIAGNSEMQSTIRILDNKGNQRLREIITYTREASDCSQLLIRFTAPAEVKGTSLLIYDYPDKSDQQWIYLPATGKVRRIVSNEKGKNFMGSEFTNADMSQLNLEEYDFEDLGTIQYKGINCHKIQASGRTKALQSEQGYSRKIIYLDKIRLIPHKEELFDRTNKAHRELLYEDYKKTTDGKWVAWKMIMNNLQNGRKSEMIVSRFNNSSQAPARQFSPTSLGK